nr:hypothetical protein [Tanacetum cinerariifolium]
EIKQFVRECDVCQRCKSDLSSYLRLLQPLPVPNTVWYSISMDFMEAQVAQAFLDNIYKLHGLLESIVSDRDKTDGQTEVVNKGLECYLTFLNTTPYELLYGQTPPIHIPYVSGESRVDSVDRTLRAREEVVRALKFHLKRTQDRMKAQADKHRRVLPQCDNIGLIQAQLVAILERRIGKVGNAAGVFILVQWSNSDPADATWESIEDIQRRFPKFNVLE